MANLSLYVSGQTEQSDVNEFFQKGLMQAGETPIAFFEGVFYESHQERVGNIAFQDYLIFTDKAVYLWARGSNKDFLDRFNLGALSVNSRNKDRDFATLNLKISREGKDPVYVIFDMVELPEAELITRLSTVIESVIEQYLGPNYRSNLPDDVSAAILEGARRVCIPRVISIRYDASRPAQPESHIGYGQDLLEQYKATIGYANPERPPQQSVHTPGTSQDGGHNPEGFSPADALKGFENMLPTDPASIKRIAGSIKEMLGDVPFKIRDQMKSDLQHIPGDVATMLTALNELLNNIADNPQAERFVMNIVKTAVRNDGVFGSVGKLLQLSSNFGMTGKKKTQRTAPKPDHSGSDENLPKSEESDDRDDNDFIARRKSIHIKSDDAATPNSDCFTTDISESVKKGGPESFPKKDRVPDNLEDDAAPRRKRIAVKSDEEEMPAIVRHMMTMDDSSPAPSSVPEEPFTTEPGESGLRKKIRILPDAEKGEAEPAENTFSAAIAEGLAGEISASLEEEKTADVPKKNSVDAGQPRGGEPDKPGKSYKEEPGKK